MCVALHVEINERTELFRPAQDRPQLGREMRDRFLRLGRFHLRIEAPRSSPRDSPPGKARRSCLTDRSSRGSRARASRATPSRGPHIRPLPVSLTTASPNKSTVNPMCCLRFLRSVFSTSVPSRPAMNCRAIPETFQPQDQAVSHGKILAARTPVCIIGTKLLSIPAKYSSRCSTISPEFDGARQGRRRSETSAP